MTIFLNNAEGGSHGTVVSTGNSGGASGDAWNTVNINGTSALVYDNTRAQHGSLAYKITHASGFTTNVAWSGLNSTQLSGRLGIEFDVIPNVAGWRILNVVSGTHAVLRVILSASGQPVLQTNNGSTTLKTFTTALQAETKYRIEYAATPGTAATLQMDLYAGDSATPLETGYSNNAVATGTTSALTAVSIGSGAGIAYSGSSLWFDDVAVNDNSLTYFGPAVTASNGSVTAPVMTATAKTNAPGAEVSAGVSGGAPATTSASLARVPTITATAGVTGVVASGSALARTPTVSGVIGTVHASVSSPAAQGSSTARNPSLAGAGTVTAVAAQAGASAIDPQPAVDNPSAGASGIDYIELRLYDAAGENFEILPKFINFQGDVKYDDLGAIEFTYPLAEAQALGLKDQVLIGLVLGFADGTAREVERYIIESTDDELSKDDLRLMRLSGRAHLAVLEDAIVYPSNWPVAAPTGHEFVDQTVGTIFRTLILRAKNRGTLAQIDETSFSGLFDSTGVSWNARHTQNYATGTNYYAVLQEFMERGYADAYLDGWSLRLLNGGSRGSHIGIGTVELRPAYNVSEMTRTTQSAESATAVLIEGEEGTAVERENPVFETFLGRRRERYVQQGGIADAGVLTLLADAELELYGRIPTEETVGFTDSGLTPWQDFDIADWVWVRYEGHTDPVERRVRQLAIGVNESREVTLGITLNTILYEQDVALKRRMDAYTGTGGAYGSTPNSGVDNTVPFAPDGVSVTPGTYFDSILKVYVGAFVVNWFPVTENVDGSALDDLSHYEVHWRYTGDSAWSATIRTAGQQSSLGYSPVTPGRALEIQVRAVDNAGNASAWSNTVTQAIPGDVAGPKKPKKPTGASRLGSIRVAWDGTAFDGSVMDADFSHVKVHIGANDTFAATPSNQVGILAGPGELIAGTDLAYGSTHWFKLVPYDTSGNAGPSSDALSITVQSLVATDVIGKVLNGASIVDGTITASDKIVGNSITGALIQGLAINTGHLAANAVTASKIEAGAISADRLTVGARSTSILRNSYMEESWIAPDGSILNRPNNWSVIYWNGTAPTLSFETAAPLGGAKSLKASFVANSGATIGNVDAATHSHFPVSSGQKWYSRVSFRPSVNIPGEYNVNLRFHTAKPPSTPWGLFDANAIWHTKALPGPFTAGTTYTIEHTVTVPEGHTTANVSLAPSTIPFDYDLVIDTFEAYPAVTDGNVTDISAGKLTTGVLQGTNRVIAGTLANARVEMNSTGIEAFRSDGVTKTFDLDSSNGDLWLSGTFTTEASGGVTRIVMGSLNNAYEGNQQWNTIAFYPQNVSWSPGMIWVSYGTDTPSDISWGQMLLSSPKLGTRDPARLTLRSEEQSNATYLEMRANVIQGRATTFEWGRTDSGGVVVHKLAYSDALAQTLSFRSAGSKRLDMKFGALGKNILYSGTESNARERFDIQAADIWFNTLASADLGFSRATSANNRPIIICSDGNAGVQFATTDVVRITTINGSNYQPIAASAFNVNSDVRRKSNLKKVKGALDVLRAVEAYDYDTVQGMPTHLSDKVRGDKYRQRGLVAQDVLEVAPDLVVVDDVDADDDASLDLYGLLATAWAAIKELSAEVDSLKKGSA